MNHRFLLIVGVIGLLGCLLPKSLSAQSLWNPRAPAPSWIEDTTARRVGDILTIIIRERHIMMNIERTEVERQDDLEAQLRNFDVLPNAFNPLPSADAGGGSSFEAEGRYDRDGRLETSMAVMVIDVMPNGNMLVEGRRRVVMDRETKTMRITGIVRPYDVTTTNTILSTSIANASIAFEGSGILNTGTHRGWLGEVLDYVWPF